VTLSSKVCLQITLVTLLLIQLQFKTVSKPTQALSKKKSRTTPSHRGRPSSADAGDATRPRGPSNGVMIQKEAALASLDLKMVPLDMQHGPGDVDMVTFDVKVASLDLQQAPRDMKMAPLDVQLLSLDMKMAPLDMQVLPLDTKMALLDVQMVPLDTKMAPLDVQMAKSAKSGLKPSLVKRCLFATACMFSVYGFYKMLS